jgi:hypothetical protein
LTRESSSWSTVETTQRSEPAVRMSFVSRRVSTPSIATTPCFFSQSESDSCERWFEGSEAISFITKASGQAPALSASSSATP